MLRLDMNLVWTIVNLIVLYLLMKHFLIGPVLEIMDKRQALIETSMANARESEEKAGSLKREFEERLTTSEEAGEKIVAQAKQEAKAQYEKIVGEADDQAERILSNARKTAEADQDRAMRDAQAQIANLVIAAAAKIVNGESGGDKDQELYEKYIEKAGDLHDTGSN